MSTESKPRHEVKVAGEFKVEHCDTKIEETEITARTVLPWLRQNGFTEVEGTFNGYKGVAEWTHIQDPITKHMVPREKWKGIPFPEFTTDYNIRQRVVDILNEDPWCQFGEYQGWEQIPDKVSGEYTHEQIYEQIILLGRYSQYSYACGSWNYSTTQGWHIQVLSSLNVTAMKKGHTKWTREQMMSAREPSDS